MKKYNLSAVMSKAWEIYRVTDQGDGIRPIFSICLSMAWQHVKNDSGHVIEEWESMPSEEQYKILSRNVKRAAKERIGRSSGDSYSEFNVTVAWMFHEHGLDGFVSDAWLRLADMLNPEYLDKLNARRVAAGKLNISLISLIYRACAYSIAAVYRSEVKQVQGRVSSFVDKDGEIVDYIDTAEAPDNSVNVTADVALSQFVNGRDEIDRAIIEGKRDGYSNKEIAAIVGLSEPAITKRLKRLKAEFSHNGLFISA